MALTDVFISWFPMLFGGSFLLSIIIFEVRERGHLRFGREPGKGAAIGLLLILGFNFVVIIPIALIMFIASFTGFTSLIEAVLTALMALYYIIPSILSGVLAYAIMKGLFDGWGIGPTGFIFSGILFLLVLLDRFALLGPAIPWIADAAIHLVGFGFGSIMIWIIFGVCLSKIVSTPKQDPEKPEQETTTRKPISQDSVTALVVRLGRRIAVDGNRDAMQTLRSLVERGPPVQNMLLAAGKIVDVNLRGALAGEDVHYAQQQLEPLTGRFGRFSKRVRNAMLVLLPVAMVSGLVAVVSLYYREILGIGFMFPAIMIPVVMGIAAQELSSYGPGKYIPPSVSLRNSFMLTDKEFSKKSRSDTARVSIALALLIGVLADALTRPPLNIVWIASAGTGLLFVAALTSRDRSLHQIRVDLDTMERRALEFIGIDPDATTESLAQVPALDVWSLSQDFEERKDGVRGPDEWKQELEIRGHSDFAKRVEKGSREAYAENQATYCYMGGGGIMLMFALITLFAFSSFAFLGGMVYFSIILAVIGAPVFLYGLIQYLRLRPSTKFYGINRKQLTGLLSILDLDIAGIDDVGYIHDRSAPSEYQAIGMSLLFRKMFIRSAMVRFPNHIPWRREDLDAIRETRSGHPKLETIALVGSLLVAGILYVFLMPLNVSYMPYFFKLIFVALALFMALTAVWSIVTYYREKQALSSIEQTGESTSNIDTMKAILDLLRSEFHEPLRLLLVGNYSQVEYTGKSFFTTNGVELREAVLVPS